MHGRIGKKISEHGSQHMDQFRILKDFKRVLSPQLPLRF